MKYKNKIWSVAFLFVTIILSVFYIVKEDNEPKENNEPKPSKSSRDLTNIPRSSSPLTQVPEKDQQNSLDGGSINVATLVDSLWEVLESGRYLAGHPKVLKRLESFKDLPPEEIIAALAEIEDYEKKRMTFEALASILGRSDPIAALAFAKTMEQKDRPELARSILKSWGQIDSRSSLEWFISRSLEPGIDFLGGLKSRSFIAGELLVLHQKNQGIADTLTIASSLGDDNLLSESLKHFFSRTPVSEIVNLDLPSNLETKVRVAAFQAMGENLAAQDTDTAIEWFGNLGLENDSELAAAAQGVAENWMRTEPETAADWWIMNAPDPFAEETINQIVELWDSTDAIKCGNWINTQNQDLVSDHVRLTFARKIVNIDHSSAVIWAETIQNPTIRDAALLEMNE